MNINRPILVTVFIICNFLIFFGNIGIFDNLASSDQPVQDVANTWLDFRSIFSDVGVFIITGLLMFIAVYIRQKWADNNKWKEGREKFENMQGQTNANIANAVKIIVDDFKSYKESNTKEIDEIRNDYQSLNTKAIQNDERILSIKEDVVEIKSDIKRKN